MKTQIENVKGREVLDSRGIPTIEVEVTLKSGIHARAMAPSGTSKGKYEVLELRDGDKNWYEGSGVKKAVEIVAEYINEALVGKNVLDHREIDSILCKLDSTINKCKFGGNAIVATSLSVLKAAAKSTDLPLYKYINKYLNKGKQIYLPMPWIHIIGGGIHANNAIDFQEIEICPVRANSYRECFHIAWKIHKNALEILRKEQNYGLVFSLCGGLAPILNSNEKAIDILIRAIEEAGYKPGVDVLIYIDVAASNFFFENHYKIDTEKRSLSSSEMVEYLKKITKKYPIYAIEDGMAQDDWTGWKELSTKIDESIELIGDDLFVTNSDRLLRGIREGICNAVIIKVNQVGTITEAFDVVKIAEKAKYRTIISARSGESEDPILTHLAIGFGVNEGKFGGLLGAESTARLNEFIRIEESLEDVERKYLWLKRSSF